MGAHLQQAAAKPVSEGSATRPSGGSQESRTAASPRGFRLGLQACPVGLGDCILNPALGRDGGLRGESH